MNNPLLENNWQTYVGILVESTVNKNQRWFHVFVPEFLPSKSGDVCANVGTRVINLPNQKTNKTEEANIANTSTIYAEYCGITTGQDVPTVYRDMQVLVFNRIGTDKWYWIPFERDDSYKTFEHHRIFCADVAQTNKSSAEKDNIEARDAGLTDDNTYFFEIDTKYRKHILMSTANSDGEEWRYFFKIDAREHTVELWDNCTDGSQPNNMIKLESKPDEETKGKITLQNAAGNSIIMQGEDMMINVPRNLTLKVGGDTYIYQEGNCSQTTSKDYDKTVGGNSRSLVYGSANSGIIGDNTEFVGQNQSVFITMQHEEIQFTRSTTAMLTAILEAPNYTITSMLAQFCIGQLTIASSCVAVKTAVWSLMSKKWLEMATMVRGSVVYLIRHL